jgi:hypothetical protein
MPGELQKDSGVSHQPTWSDLGKHGEVLNVSPRDFGNSPTIPRMGRMLVAVAAGMLVAGCGSAPSTPAARESVASAPGWVQPSHVAAPSTTKPALDFSDEADDRFVADLVAKGVPVADPFDMINAGYGVCLMMVNEGASLIDASVWVMDAWGVTGDQAGDIAVAAVDVYCPEESALK